jgi:hypothetical protein
VALLSVGPIAPADPLSAGGTDGYVEVEVGGAEHIDEAIDAEQVDLAPDQVGDSGLSDAESTGGLGLGQPAWSM